MKEFIFYTEINLLNRRPLNRGFISTFGFAIKSEYGINLLSNLPSTLINNKGIFWKFDEMYIIFVHVCNLFLSSYAKATYILLLINRRSVLSAYFTNRVILRFKPPSSEMYECSILSRH